MILDTALLSAQTPDQALSVVRTKLKRAELNKARTVIAAVRDGHWYPVAYKGSEGWLPATMAQKGNALPATMFPSIPPTALEVYCKLRGWAGGTIHQAVADLKKQGKEFRDELLDALNRVPTDDTGLDMILGAI